MVTLYYNRKKRQASIRERANRLVASVVLFVAPIIPFFSPFAEAGENSSFFQNATQPSIQTQAGGIDTPISPSVMEDVNGFHPVHVLTKAQFEMLPKEVQRLASSRDPRVMILFCKEASFRILNNSNNSSEDVQLGIELIKHGLGIAQSSGIKNKVTKMLRDDLSYLKKMHGVAVQADVKPTMEQPKADSVALRKASEFVGSSGNATGSKGAGEAKRAVGPTYGSEGHTPKGQSVGVGGDKSKVDPAAWHKASEFVKSSREATGSKKEAGEAKRAVGITYCSDSHIKKGDSDASGDGKTLAFTYYSLDAFDDNSLNVFDDKALYVTLQSSIVTPPENKDGEQYDTTSATVEVGVLPKPNESGFSASLAVGQTNAGLAGAMKGVMQKIHRKNGIKTGGRSSPRSTNGHIYGQTKFGYTINPFKGEIGSTGWYYGAYGRASATLGTDLNSCGVAGGVTISNDMNGFSPLLPTQGPGELGLFLELSGKYVGTDVVTGRSGTNPWQGTIEAGASIGVAEGLVLKGSVERSLTGSVKDPSRKDATKYFLGVVYSF